MLKQFPSNPVPCKREWNSVSCNEKYSRVTSEEQSMMLDLILWISHFEDIVTDQASLNLEIVRQHLERLPSQFFFTLTANKQV